MTAAQGKPTGVTLDISSDLESVRRARGWLSGRLDAAGYPPAMIGDILLAAGEALNNIVKHAYGGRPGHPIHVHLIAGPDAAEIILADEAPRTFDPPAFSPPRPEDLAEGGYGLSLIHDLVDEAHYSRAAGRGTVLHLLKRVTTDTRKAAS